MWTLGDLICRRFFSFVSIQHRLATAFLTGLLLSSCFMYLAALLFAGSGQPLLRANLIFFVIAAGLVFWLRNGTDRGEPGDGAFRLIFRKIRSGRPKNSEESDPGQNAAASSDRYIKFDSNRRPVGRPRWDWLCLGICVVFGCWLMFSTLNFADGNIYFAIKSWSDFGPNLSLTQSFVFGDNFPSEHPFFPGEPLRYHFLFWFQAANLSFLGLNIVWSVNLLSMLSLIALLILIMTLAELLFNSRPVARTAALLFFFASSSLSYIPFLRLQESIGGALSSVLNLKDFLRSGYPYRGDDWGALSVAVFSNQRHLISAVGIIFIVMIFLVDFYRRNGAITVLRSANEELPPMNESEAATDIAPQAEPEEPAEVVETIPRLPSPENLWSGAKAFIFCGLLIGALPYWNSAAFVSASVIIAGLFVFFPYRRYTAVLIAVTILLGLPQVLMLRSGNLAASGQSLFHWGYIVSEPTIPLVLKYLAWTFGFKWVFILVAIWLLPGSHRRLLLAFSALLPVVFLLQLSTDAFNNHKLINIWNTFASVYIAYAIWELSKKNFLRAALTSVLLALTIFGAIVDLFPLHNDTFISVPYANDRLTTWLLESTKPHDIFLTDILLSHPILFTGRKIYLGNTLFAWTAGYDLAEREKTYRKIFQERNVTELLRLLNANKIAYVAIDDGVRRNKTISGFNESIYQQNFEKVFEDTERRYGNLNIYRITKP